jgi:hypothetical protein
VVPKKYTAARFCQKACRIKMVFQEMFLLGRKPQKIIYFYISKIEHRGVQKRIQRSVTDVMVNTKGFLLEKQPREDYWCFCISKIWDRDVKFYTTARRWIQKIFLFEGQLRNYEQGVPKNLYNGESEKK